VVRTKSISSPLKETVDYPHTRRSGYRQQARHIRDCLAVRLLCQLGQAGRSSDDAALTFLGHDGGVFGSNEYG
jgi:hypothetical protein